MGRGKKIPLLNKIKKIPCCCIQLHIFCIIIISLVNMYFPLQRNPKEYYKKAKIMYPPNSIFPIPQYKSKTPIIYYYIFFEIRKKYKLFLTFHSLFFHVYTSIVSVYGL